MHLNQIFTTEEMRSARDALDGLRSTGAYEPGRWMVSAVNRVEAAQLPFPPSLTIRDITMRTIEQVPGVINDEEDRERLLRLLVEAGVPSLVTSCFRRGHTPRTMAHEVEVAKGINPECEVVYSNAVTEKEMALASASGIDTVQVWSAPYMGAAAPVSAGAVYHRAWHGRDWRDLRIPRSTEQHIDRSRRLTAAGVSAGVRVSTTVNLLAYATEDYVAQFCAATAEEGATEIVLADSSGGVGPEAWERLVAVAAEAAPNVAIGVHAHNAFGVGIAGCVRAAVAGATVLETAVNGLEMGSGGSQVSTCGTALAFEALYGVRTGLDMSRMTQIAELVRDLSGYEIPWSEPGLGSGLFMSAAADEYEMEYAFDPLIHASILPETVGAVRIQHIGATTGPHGMSEKLRQMGLDCERHDVEAILAACKEKIRAEKRTLTDHEVAALASSVPTLEDKNRAER